MTRHVPFRLLALWLPALCGAADIPVTGRVLDETNKAVAGARVELRNSVGAVAAFSDEAGRFTLSLAAGEYDLRVERAGYFLETGRKIAVDAPGVSLAITLTHQKELAESIDVTYSPPAIDLQQPAEHKELENVEIQSVPYPAPQDFRNSLALLNGVLQDTAGRNHFNGGGVEQTSYSIDGFHVNDPVTGRLDARLNIDSAGTIEVESSRVSAEYGRGSAGMVDVKTKMGDDRLRFGGTNFIPGVSSDQGIHINKWTPRLELSGPLQKGRAWFYNGFDLFYDLDTVHGLPRGENRARGITGSNLTRLQVNLTAAHILTASFLVNHGDRTRYGLSFLTPTEATTRRRNELYFTTLRDQIYFARGALVEIGFADTRGALRDLPQGSTVYQITPEGNRGNYFVDLDRHFYRQQWLANVVLPAMAAGGSHQVKFGVDLERRNFHQRVERHPYEILRTDESVARYVTFAGGPFQQRRDFDWANYVQDRWTPRAGVLVEAGLRAVWTQLPRTLLWSPRLGVVWAPARLRDTKFSAGVGVFNDAIDLGTVARAQDQVSLATFFPPQGGPAQGPVATQFVVNEAALHVPRYRNYSVSVERKLPWDLYGKASYLRRSGSQGFTFLPPPGVGAAWPVSATYLLSNTRRDHYDALELAVRRTFARRFEWSAGYTRSSARTSAAVDYSLESPIFAPQMAGPVPWDAPNRFLSWGWAPFPKRLLPPWLQFVVHETDVQYLAEYRTGFPFGVVSEEGLLVGRPNARRYPGYFNLNLHFERRFRALHYLWAWRFGFNNVTNNGNPNAVNNNIDSPAFLAYGRGQARAFSVRLRFLGKR